MRIHLLLVAGVFILFSVETFAAEGPFTIKWLPDYEKKLSEESTFRSLNFEGAAFDENMLPVYSVTEPVTSNTTGIKVLLTNVVTEPLKNASAIRDLSTIQA